METTSHFVGIELKSEVFSDLYVELFNYLKSKNIENILVFQNLLSIHITLYYFEKKLDKNCIDDILKEINEINIHDDIYIRGFDYFYNGKNKKNCYFKCSSLINFKEIRNKFHLIFDRTKIIDNQYDFIPHITFFKILDSIEFEKHQSNIENIINNYLNSIFNININNNNGYLYKVNSTFKEEIQIKL